MCAWTFIYTHTHSHTEKNTKTKVWSSKYSKMVLTIKPIGFIGNYFIAISTFCTFEINSKLK